MRFLLLPAAIFLFILGSDAQLYDEIVRDILKQVVADLRDRYPQRNVSDILAVKGDWCTNILHKWLRSHCCIHHQCDC
jgi:hypothetical protein